MVIVFNVRLCSHCVLFYFVIITKNTCWNIYFNPEYVELLSKCLYHINSHAHSAEFRTKFTGLDCGILLIIPMYWCRITKNKYPSVTVPIVIFPFRVFIHKPLYFHRTVSLIRRVNQNKLFKSLVKFFPVILFEIVWSNLKSTRIK